MRRPTPHESAAALRKGAWNNIVVANQLDPHGTKEFLMSLADLTPDWNKLKQLNADKDAKIADLTAKLADATGKLPDAATLATVDEIHQAATTGVIPAPTPAPSGPNAPAAS